jgi:hypothetical protein
MLRQALFAFVMLGLCLAFAAAETIKGKVTKIDDKGVTVVNKANKDGKTFSFAKDCKFCKEVTKDDKTEKEPLKEGAKADVFTNIGKGVNATLTTNDAGEVTELVLTAKKKKGT